jgi:hypothetical protein
MTTRRIQQAKAAVESDNMPKNRDYLKILSMQETLMAAGKPFKIKVINGNYELISGLFKGKTTSKSDYTTEELKFIKSVRHYVVKNEVHLEPKFQEQQYFAEDIHYIKVKKVILGKVFKDVVEVDIDQAYWETAYQLGIINDDIYIKGRKGNISKKARLTALGSLAKKVYIHHYSGKNSQGRTTLSHTSIERDPLLENLWFTICKRVSDVMHDVIDALGKDFIFYWVDGIYMKNTSDNIQKAMKIFHENGYNSKFKPINQILFHKKGFTVNDFGTITREFTYPNYNKKGQKVDYARNAAFKKFADRVMDEEIDLLDHVQEEVDKELNK